MKFGGHATGAQRVAETILKQQHLDTSPSFRTLAGSDEKVLSLRPTREDKMLGRPGPFRLKATTSI